MFKAFFKTKNSESRANLNVAELVAETLNSRDVVLSLKNNILEADAQEVDLDFSEVRFISRSAAHELIKLREDFSINSSKKVNIVNANSDVSNMLRVVAANRIVPKSSTILSRSYNRETIESLVSSLS